MTETEPVIETLDLPSVTESLNDSYELWKVWEAEKNDDKEKFYLLADHELGKQEQAEKYYSSTVYDEESETTVLERIKRFNPGWILDEWRNNEGVIEAVLKEDISLKPFTYVNKEMGRVYQRTVRQGSPQIDDAYMKAADPDLYAEITFELPWGERVTPPLKDLTAKQLGGCARFIFRSKPSVSLAPPRDAKLEELE